MEPTDSHQPIKDPAPEQKPMEPEQQPSAQANQARSGNPEVQMVVQELREVLRRRAARYLAVGAHIPNWTLAQLIDLWPCLADADRSRQYELRKLVGTLDRFRFAMRTELRRHSELAIKLRIAQHAARYTELPWSDLASQDPVRDWLLNHAHRPKTPILQQLGIDVFHATAEPWVTIEEWVATLKQLWPHQLGSQDNYRVSRKSMYWTIAAPPAEWFIGLTLQRALMPEITDPFKIVGITTQWGRPMWAIRLEYLKPGRLREALEPIWQARAARYWVEEGEMSRAVAERSVRTKQRFHLSRKRRTPKRKQLILEYIRRMVAAGRHNTKELCDVIQRLYGITLTPRTILNYKREAAWLLQQERARSDPSSDSPGPSVSNGSSVANFRNGN